MLRIAIVEDEKEYQLQLVEMLNRYEKEHNEEFIVRTFSDGIDIMDHYSAEYDLIFLDIHMKHQDGMTTAQEIRKLDSEVMLVFITALAQYAIEGYLVEALDFILKPAVYEQLEATMDKVLQFSQKHRKEKLLVVMEDAGKRKISTDDIYYIDVEGHNLYVHAKEDVYELRGTTLKILADELEEFQFVYSGQSHLVNLKYVDEIRGDIVVVHKEELYLSRSRKKDFIAAFADYVGMEV